MSFKDRRMPDGSQHLTLEQVRSVLRQHMSDRPAHLDQCTSCAELVRQLRLESQRAATVSGECVAHDQLLQVAGSQRALSSEELSHVAMCSRCSTLLRELTDDLSELPPNELAALSSSSREWQANMGRRMAANRKESGKFFFPSPWKWTIAWIAAAVAILVAIVGSAVFVRPRRQADRLLARSFEKQRLSVMRIEGASYSQLGFRRGSTPTVMEMPSEALEAATLARRNLEKDATNSYWHSVQGYVYLLEGAPDRAINELRVAEAGSPSDSRYRLALGSALCENAIQNGTAANYVEGLDVLRQFVVEHSGDAVALYNLGVCLYYTGALGEAKIYLQQAAKAERDRSWKPDIQQWLDRIEARLRGASTRPLPDFGWQAPEGADAALAAAVDQNRRGKPQAALAFARSAELSARQSKNLVRLSWAKFEQVYALQRLAHADLCRAEAEETLSLAAPSLSPELRAAFLTEAAVCSEILGDFRRAESFYIKAKEAAANSKSNNLLLRIIGLEAALYNSEGLHAQSERLDLDVLGTESNYLNSMRRYQFLSDLYFNAVAQGYFFSALEFEKEAQSYAAQSGNAVIAAVAKEDLAEACLRIGDRACAVEQEQRAEAQLWDLDEPSRRLYATTWSMRRELIAPVSTDTLQSLINRPGESIRNNHYLSVPFFLSAGYRALSRGDLVQAKKSAMSAAAEVARLRRNLNNDQARFTWSQDARPVFELLVRIRLAENQSQQALDCWESFRTLLRTNVTQICGRTHLPASGNTVFLVFARVKDGYVRWVLLPNGALQQTILASERIDRLSRLFAMLCSTPETNTRTIADLSDQLSNLLLAGTVPGNSAADIVVEPDSVLGDIPYRALRHDGQWLGLRHSVSIVPGLWAVRSRAVEDGEDSRLLLIGNSADRRLLDSEAVSALGRGYRTVTLTNFSEISSRIDAARVVYYVGHASEDEAMRVALELHSRLQLCRFAVLAACHTRGMDNAQATGFGVLPDRMLQAGALAVIASRWDLDSKQTQKLLRPILESGAKCSLSEQLRDASRELVRAGISHPYYWAGLDVYGAPVITKGRYP